MALLSICRLRNIRKLLFFPCVFFFGVLLVLLHAMGPSARTRNSVKTTPYVGHGEYLWDKRNFNIENYLKGERNRTNNQLQKIFPSMLENNENYSKVNFIPKKDKYFSFGFDIEASNNVPIGRRLPDARLKECMIYHFDKDNVLTSSVIIAFHNEARSTLLRTVVSILQRTPPIILEEIILVDDNSDYADDGSLLSALPKVRVIRNGIIEGLARSRTIGAREAEGDLLVFLDSHCEVNVGWLEPIVDLLIAAPKALVSPAIDQIDRDGFEYEIIRTYFKGGFDWRLHFKWIPLTTHEVRLMGDPTHPFWSPVISGGMFAANREWFFEIGAHDSGFKSTGAEDIEISLKSWLCGGSVYICPCSRVGHVFHLRNFKKVGMGEEFTRNAKRVAEVWLDEYKIFFYQEQSKAYDVPIGSVEDSITIKQNLECKPFRWYMEAIYPELKLPSNEIIAFGQIKQGMRCLAEKNRLLIGPELRVNQTLINMKAGVIIDICDERSVDQQGWTYGGRIKSAIHKTNRCLTATTAIKRETKRPKRRKYESSWKEMPFNDNNFSVIVELKGCNKEIQQKWTRYGKMLYNNFYKLCLEICHEKNNVMSLCLNPCTKRHSTQQWEFTIDLQPSRVVRLG